ncbi:methyltransferase domain-containing protein [Kribbella sancticallisti]
MAEALSPDESTPGSFKASEADRQNVAQLATILDLIASKPAVQHLKAWVLAALAPAEGESALDVGSGTGEDLVELTKRVGPSGRAVGVEPSPGLRAESVRRAEGIEVVDGDALSLPFDDASFDAVRCERVLQHISEPGKAVSEMARVLRPGGRIALVDTDWATAIVYPADPEVLSRIFAFLLAETANPYSGRTLRALLADAGLTTVDETAATWLEPQSGAAQGYLTMMATTCAALGVITAPEAEAFQQGLAEAAARGSFHMSLTMYAVAATKAPAG